MPSILRKTAKGVAEVDTREHRLVPRLRSMLIMVDGKRSDVELALLMPQHGDQALASLLDQGFVEIVATVDVPAPGAPRAVAAAPRAAPAAQPGFDVVRRNVVRALNDALGPAAETLALRIERTQKLEDLRLLLPQAVQAVGNLRGRAAAEAFAARFSSV